MSDYIIKDGELYHYGRKGMRWGQNIFGKIKAFKVAKQRKENLKKAREVRAKRQKLLKAGKLSSKQMTDAELKARISRLELEKRYNDLMSDRNRATATRGKTFVNKFTNSVVEKVAENSLADVVAQALKAAAVKGVNKMTKEEIVYTNNKKKS